VRLAAVRASGAAQGRVWLERAVAAFAAGDAATAEAALARVWELDAGNPAAHLLEARLAILSGRTQEARGHLEVASRAGEPAERCDAYNLLGVLAMRERHLQKGRVYFEAARGTDPSDPSAYVNLARWHLEAERSDSAAWVLRRGLTLAEPRDPVQQAYRALETGQIF
jgi:Tfp pilus assembly protein PilF